MQYDVEESIEGDLIGNLPVRYAIFAHSKDRKLRRSLVIKEP